MLQDHQHQPDGMDSTKHTDTQRTCFRLRFFTFFLLILLGCLFLSYRHNYGVIVEFILPEPTPSRRVSALNTSSLDLSLNQLARHDVQTQTQWGAPILWEGTFDPTLYDEAHKLAGSSVALTVFAVGRYLEVYLKTFLDSAEKHFMTALPVTYYVFTDAPGELPEVELGPLRSLKVVPVQRHSRWQDISMMRMKTISETIESELSLSFSHVFCFDVDQEFTGRWGSEALGSSVAQIHSGYYKIPLNLVTFDRNPKSKAYMETGDWYYHAAIFGGSWKEVKALVDFCYDGIMEDKRNNVEAQWHDESHLNKYFFLHKPSRLLSPEYCWSPGSGNAREDMKIQRLVWATKYYNVLRSNKS